VNKNDVLYERVSNKRFPFKQVKNKIPRVHTLMKWAAHAYELSHCHLTHSDIQEICPFLIAGLGGLNWKCIQTSARLQEFHGILLTLCLSQQMKEFSILSFCPPFGSHFLL
jgi:hypothetical protein